MLDLNDIIDRCKSIIVSSVNFESLHSLYIGGSINPQDRIKESDIDLIGIVNDNFPEEIEVYKQLINGYIISSRSIDSQVPFEWIPKAVLYLAALELVIVKRVKFTTSFSEIQNQWINERQHIVHDSIEIRHRCYNISETEKKEFISKTISYMDNMTSVVKKESL